MEVVLTLQQGLIAAIKHEMFRHRLEVPDVAAALGVSPGWVYRLLSGGSEGIDFKYLEKLSKLFRVSPAKLLGGPVARDKATIHEAFEVLKEEFERISKQPDLSRVPSDLLALLSTAGEGEFSAVRLALEGTVLGKEAAKTVLNKRGKRKNSAAD